MPTKQECMYLNFSNHIDRSWTSLNFAKAKFGDVPFVVEG
jgi:hypothetical protein